MNLSDNTTIDKELDYSSEYNAETYIVGSQKKVFPPDIHQSMPILDNNYTDIIQDNYNDIKIIGKNISLDIHTEII